MMPSLVCPEKAKVLFARIGYDVDDAVAIQRRNNREHIEALYNAIIVAVETTINEDDLAALMYIESIIALLLE